MLDDPLTLRLQAIERRLKQVEMDLATEREINQLQAQAIAHRQENLNRRQWQAQRGIEVLTVAFLGFLACCVIILLGLRIDFGWASYQLPVAALVEGGALAAGVTAVLQYFLSKRQERREIGDKQK